MVTCMLVVIIIIMNASSQLHARLDNSPLKSALGHRGSIPIATVDANETPKSPKSSPDVSFASRVSNKDHPK